MNWNQALFPSLKGGVDARSRKCREATLVRADGVVSSAKLFRPKDFAELTTPSAALRRLRAFLLMPQPPLLFKEGNVYKNSTFIFLAQNAGAWQFRGHEETQLSRIEFWSSFRPGRSRMGGASRRCSIGEAGVHRYAYTLGSGGICQSAGRDGTAGSCESQPAGL